jgi:hypothetical protein
MSNICFGGADTSSVDVHVRCKWRIIHKSREGGTDKGNTSIIDNWDEFLFLFANLLPTVSVNGQKYPAGRLDEC